MNKGDHISILGAGISGIGAAKLALQKGMKVFVSDASTLSDSTRAQLNDLGLDWEEGGHDEERILSSDYIIKSPGIPQHADLIVKARDKKITIISEIDFASRFCKGKIVAITGSNGKTTTSTLMHHMLEKAGKKVCLVGNIGTSFAGILTGESYDYYVLEVSSFQLEDLEVFRPDIAIILNITPDHLDRYNNVIQLYANAKFQIASHQGSGDYFLYNADDEVIASGLENLNKDIQKIPFSIKKKVPAGGFLEHDQININLNNKPFTMSIHDLALQGKHNIYNSMAASIAGRILELRKDLIRDSLADFQNVEHRLEHVMDVHGIAFINDSKATNVNSTWYALESMETPVIWIVGGVDKGNDYESLKSMVEEKVKGIVCLGKDNKKIQSAFKGLVAQIDETESATEAVKLAYAMGSKGDTVLLSPACASFDLFENYEDRGHQFKKAVRSL